MIKFRGWPPAAPAKGPSTQGYAVAGAARAFTPASSLGLDNLCNLYSCKKRYSAFAAEKLGRVDLTKYKIE